MLLRLRERLFKRTSAANVLMLLFILLTSVGVMLVAPSPGWGLIAAGVASGIFGFLLGLE